MMTWFGSISAPQTRSEGLSAAAASSSVRHSFVQIPSLSVSRQIVARRDAFARRVGARPALECGGSTPLCNETKTIKSSVKPAHSKVWLRLGRATLYRRFPTCGYLRWGWLSEPTSPQRAPRRGAATCRFPTCGLRKWLAGWAFHRTADWQSAIQPTASRRYEEVKIPSLMQSYPSAGNRPLSFRLIRVLAALVLVLGLTGGCVSSPPPPPVPIARQQSQLEASAALRLSEAQQWTAAAREWQQVAERSAALDDRITEAVAWHNCAQAHRELGDAPGALAFLERAAALNREIGRTNEWWRNQIALLQVESQLDKPKLAERFAPLIPALTPNAPAELRGLFLNELGCWQLDRRELPQAEATLRQAEGAFRQQPFPTGLATVLLNEARLEMARTNWDAALGHWREARAHFDKLANADGIARAYAGEGQALLEAHRDLPGAERALRRAADGFRWLRRPVEYRAAVALLIECLKAQDRTAEADRLRARLTETDPKTAPPSLNPNRPPL